MAKIYEVTLPSHHPKSGTYKVVSGSVGAVKELVCKSLDRNRIPRGTDITKLGLTSSPASKSLFSVPKSSGVSSPASRKAAGRRGKKTSNDTERSPMPRGKSPIKDNKLTAEERASKRIADERADTANIRGIQIRKSQGIKLTKNLSVTEASILAEKGGRYDQISVGEDAEIVLTKGHTIWILCDQGGKLSEAVA